MQVSVPRGGRMVDATIVRRWPGWGLRRHRPTERPFVLVEFPDGTRRVYDLELIERKEQERV